MFKFGVCEKTINPKLGSSIPGYFEDRRATAIKDDLFVRACVFENGDSIFSLVVVDAVELYREDALKIRALASKLTGIDESLISVSSTHAHTAGPTWTWEGSYRKDDEYVDMLIQQAAEAVKCAFDSRKAAKFGYTKSEITNIAFVRRFYLKDGGFGTNAPAENVLRAETEPDNTFFLAKVEYEDGTLAAYIENFALHPDTVGGCEISADYVGALSKLIKEKYGENVVNIFINSAAGDINHVNKTAEVQHTHKQIGKIIFDKIEEIKSNIKTNGDVKVRMQSKLYMTPTRKPSIENYEIAKRILAGEDTDFPGKEDGPEVRRVFAYAAKRCYESKVKELETEIKAAQIGDLCFAIWPGEVFCDFAKMIRKEFPGKDIAVSAQANTAYDCYIPTLKAFENGGYEPRESVELMPCKEAGYMLVENSKELLKSF